jgi:hypothetical protein
MSGETESEPSSWTPDLLQQQTDRSIKAERDWVTAQLDVRDSNLAVIRERLNGIDRATVKFEDSLMRVPTETDRAVGNLKEIHGERFKSIDLQFRAANDAVKTALAAAKEAVAEQNKSSSMAILKSEAGTLETINKLSELVDVNIKGLLGQITDMKETINSQRQEFIAYQARQGGGVDKRDDYRANIAIVVSVVAVIAAVVFGVYAATGR